MIDAYGEFVIVGGAAVNGQRASTGGRDRDLDLLLRQTDANLERLIDVQLNWLRFNDTRIANSRKRAQKSRIVDGV
ncbi:hypothetical protein CO676_11970 [Sinorhizobium sp. BJ1]|uniref:Uncharacterized protein n=1 Tax=Sinorhizobium fredii (strain USDA 257) TaxID=1185652 RepID=I3XE80_SINF2|nr:hypothetical protein USDA257_c56730 [Sinorhizobium fredii USDA 257]PDT83379.1 hypothetical protein CO676_11970 [Sinorhizobium sp. BJ1]